jgi:DNA-binding transcriptional ArsR family regulator
MPSNKISNLVLEQLVKEGNGVSEIARKLGVTKGAVSKRLKALDVAITKNVTLHYAGELVERKIDTLGQLLKINDYANELLDGLMHSDRKNDLAAQIPDDLDQKISFLDWEDEDSDFRPKERGELALKAMAEIRSQLKLQLEIFNSLYNLTAAAEFQKEVLESIGSVSRETRERIIRNLQKARAIRSAIEFS